MVNTNGAADLESEFRKLSTSDREALAAKASAAPKPQAAVFAVLVLPGGAALAVPDLAQLENYDTHPATAEEVLSGSYTVVSDLQASKTAQVVMMTAQQSAIAAANQAENARIMEALRNQGLG